MCRMEVESKMSTATFLVCILVEASVLGICAVGGVFLWKNYMSPQAEDKKKMKTLLSSLGFGHLANKLNKYEMLIASQLVNPSHIDVTFQDIAGLDYTIKLIKSNIILPLLTYPVLKGKSQFFQPPKGVLLHGPPGCGKTMIAKAIAKEANANFINLEVPTLTNKWYGESQKLASAVFTLAEKLQPCIIFIDEIDTFLRTRELNDHEATAMMKAQFMIRWDGLYSSKDRSSVMVLGATNRPNHVDEAIRRRMPAKFEISLPNCDQRKEILELLLKDEPLKNDVDIEKLADITERFSSSDLKEFCRNAVFTRVEEESVNIIKSIAENRNDFSEFLLKLRKANMNDFEVARDRMLQNKFVTKDDSCFATAENNGHCKSCSNEDSQPS